MDGKEAGSNQHSAISQNTHQNQNLFTAKDAEDAKEEKGLPRLHTDETDKEPGLRRMDGKPGQGNAEERIRQRAEALVRRIGETCDELERLAEENPELVGRVRGGAEEHKDAYLRLKARLALADTAPRCRWVRTDGTSCGSPQMKKHIYCFAHRQMMEARALALSLPALEDANAIQVGLMRIQKALIDDTISTKKAGLLLYSMQLALQNVGQMTFGQAKTEELVRETVDEDAALSSQHLSVSQDQTSTTETRRRGEEENLPRINADARGFEEKENQGLPLTNSDTQKGLPRMDAGARGLGKTIKPVEWRPPAEMFRMDTQEGMEAYEESFRRKIAPRLEGERRPVGTVNVADDPAQPRAAVHPGKPIPGLSGTPAVSHEHRNAETRANLG